MFVLEEEDRRGPSSLSPISKDKEDDGGGGGIMSTGDVEEMETVLCPSFALCTTESPFSFSSCGGFFFDDRIFFFFCHLCRMFGGMFRY